MKISVVNDGNQKLAQVFYKGKMITLEYVFSRYIMTKGNKTYGEGFSKVPKSLEKIYKALYDSLK